MRLAVLSAALSAALACSAGAQDARALTPARAWPEFQRAHGPGWVSEWHPATGTPRAVYGPGLRLDAGPLTTIEAAQAQADRVVERFAALLGRGSSVFVPHLAGKQGSTWTLVYGQSFRGLRVLGARADVRLHQSGVLSLLGSVALPIPAAFDTTPTLDPSQAQALAALHLQLDALVEDGPREPELVIWGQTDSLATSPIRLAWEVAVQRPSLRQVGRAYVDAHSGASLDYRSDWHECGFGGAVGGHEHEARIPASLPVVLPAPQGTNVSGTVMAWTNTGLKPLDPAVNLPVANVQVSVVGGGTGHTDASGQFSIAHTGTTPVTVRVEFLGRRVGNVTPRQGTKLVQSATVTPGTPAAIQIYQPTQTEIERGQASAYWAINDGNEWVRSLLPTIPAQMATIDRVTAFTSLTQTCNAHYVSNTVNFYQSGGGCNHTAYSTVIYHEWGHGLDDVMGGISQTHGLSEGWGDIIAILRTGQPIVGEDFFTTGGFIRTALNTRTYPPSGGVHQQGEVWMGFAWDLRNELIARLGQSAGAAHCERIVISSIVADAADQPTAVREVFIADDDDGNLNNGTPNYDALAAAADKRKLPYPQKQSQVPGTWVAYGQGCQGTGQGPGRICVSANGSNTTNLGIAGSAALMAIEVTAPTNMQVDGFELLMSSGTTGTLTMQTHIYTVDAAGKPAASVRQGTMTLQPTTTWSSTVLSPAYAVAPGQKFFIVFNHPANAILPIVFGGPTSTVYRRDVLFGWQPAFFSTWAWRTTCATGGGAVPALANAGVPEIGTSFSLGLSQAAANVPVVLMIGGSNTQWGTIPLPFNLGVIGAPNCLVLAAGDIQLGRNTDASGAATQLLALPPDQSLVGADMFSQFVVRDAAANQLGLALTNAGQGKIGKP